MPSEMYKLEIIPPLTDKKDLIEKLDIIFKNSEKKKDEVDIELIYGLLTDGYFFRWNNVHQDVSDISLSMPNHSFILSTGECDENKVIEKFANGEYKNLGNWTNYLESKIEHDRLREIRQSYYDQ